MMTCLELKVVDFQLGLPLVLFYLQSLYLMPFRLQLMKYPIQYSLLFL